MGKLSRSRPADSRILGFAGSSPVSGFCDHHANQIGLIAEGKFLHDYDN